MSTDATHPADVAVAADELRDASILATLDAGERAELARRGTARVLEPGDHLFHEGDPATCFHVLLDGELETTRDVAGEQAVMLRHTSGGYLGAIALLTATPYRGSTRAVTRARLFELGGEDFHRLVLSHPPLLRELLQVFAPVMGSIQGLARDREKLLALGKLSAGLAHELNNPAASAVRAADALRQADAARQDALHALLEADRDGAGRLVALTTLAPAPADRLVALDPLEAGDREDRIADDLRTRGVAQPYAVAALVVEAGLPDATIAGTLAALEPALVGHGLRFLAADAANALILDDLHESTTRIVDLVGAVKRYSFLDQAPRQRVDVHEGLESTLAVFAHQLREGDVRVVREFAAELPPLEAHGSELNQVWTNLIDNAIAAIGSGPEGRSRAAVITLRTSAEAGRIAVEIADTGPGIPEAERERIFDAFYTTKPVGSGTGLGLDIARRIVVRHRGELTVACAEPGATCFRVVLPAG